MLSLTLLRQLFPE